MCGIKQNFIQNWDLIWAAAWQNHRTDMCARRRLRSPGHPPSLIRDFAVRMSNPWVLSFSLSAQRRQCSDWADAQAELSLRLAHMPIVVFVILRLIYVLLRRKRWSLLVFYLCIQVWWLHVLLLFLSEPTESCDQRLWNFLEWFLLDSCQFHIS